MREVPAPTRGSGPVHCCGGHRERCIFGHAHVWGTWYENGKLQRTPDTFYCHWCDGVCTADEETPGTEMPAAPTGPSRAWADLIALPTETLRAMAASGRLTAAEQWGAEDELGERDDPSETPAERAARLYPGLPAEHRPY
jgi:hypothetical protein